MSREKTCNFLKQALDLGAEQSSFANVNEPFTSDEFENCVGDAKRMGYKYVYATTNGALANEKRLRKLLENGLDSLRFSINAGNAETYKKVHGKDDFNKVIENVFIASRLRREINPNLLLNVSFAENIFNKGQATITGGQLNNLLKDAVDQIYIMPTFNHGGMMSDEANQGTVSKTDKPWGRAKAYGVDTDFSVEICNYPFRRAHISVEGYLVACCMDGKNELVTADLNKVSLAQAWNGPKMRQIRGYLLNNTVPENCKCYNCIHNTDNKITPFDKIPL